MSNQAPMTHATKAGTSPSFESETKPAKPEFATEAIIADFFKRLHDAKNEVMPPEVPTMEAPKIIISHFNQGLAAAGVKKAGYFIYQGVKVFEEGRRAEAETRDSLTTEDKMHGGKA